MNKKNDTTYSLSDLNNQLNKLKDIINSFEQDKLFFNPESQKLIQELTERKGNFLGIKYKKDPTPNELLDVSCSLYNSTNQGFAKIYKQLNLLHVANENIFSLFIILNQLSGISQQRIVGAYSLINNTQKEIKKNCIQTSIQGEQLKEMVLMYLQHIKTERQFHFFNSTIYKILVGIIALSSLLCSLLL